jgi:transcriptional regulator with XRE-family HTH domain
MENAVATFAQLVRHYRQQKGLTQQQLAEQAGLSTSYMTLLETGRRTRPSWRTVISLAKAFRLNSADRRAFMRSAGYSEDLASKTTVDLSPPVMKKLSQFLSLPAGSPEGPSVLRESLDLLESLAVEKAMPRNNRKAIKAARMIMTAFFSTPRDDRIEGKRSPKGKKESSEIVLADRLRELINVFVDGTIPIERRISIAEELASFLKWKMQGKKINRQSHISMDLRSSRFE